MDTRQEIIIKGNVDETWMEAARAEHLRIRLGKNGILIIGVMSIIHQLLGMVLNEDDCTMTLNHRSLIAFPMIIKPSWYSILELNYSRPPNSVLNAVSEIYSIV